MRAAKVISILLTAGLAAIACGSDEEESPTAGNADSGSGGTGTGGTLAGGTGGAPAGGTGGTGVGGDGSGGTAAAGGNTGGSAGAISDASVDTSTGGTGGGGVAAEVSCATGGDSGPVTCSGGQACCVRFPGSDYCAALDGCECADGGQCLSVPVACDGPEDCSSGEVCCGTLSTADAIIPRYTRVGCQATCDTANDEYEFCHAGDGGTACRETGTFCRTSTYMPPYEICAPTG